MNISSYVHVITKMELIQGIIAYLKANKNGKTGIGRLSAKNRIRVGLLVCDPYIDGTY